jgi:methionine-S-sulfoxide reductase
MKTEFATFGGGCFWGVEKFLQEIPGVIDAVSGYAGGNTIDPTYSDVCGGRTGHAEVVNVEFNPTVISFKDLVKKFLKTYRDTNEVNLNSSSQYRSIILYRDEQQKSEIETAFAEFYAENTKIVTTQVRKLSKFYEAEPYHQDYYGSCRVEASSV